MESVEQADIGLEGVPRAIPRNGRLLNILRYVVGITILTILILLVDPEKILSAFQKANPVPILLAFLLLSANIGVQTWKWKMMLAHAGQLVSWREAVASLLFGITAGSVTPGQVGEIGGRALRLNGPVPGRIVGLTMLDKMQMLFVMTLGAMPSLAYYTSDHLSWGPDASGGVFFGSILLFFKPTVLLWVLEKAGIRRLRAQWIHDCLSAFALFTGGQLFRLFFITLLFYSVIYFQMYLLISAFTRVTPVEAYLGFSAMMFLKALLPISIGDLGIREASSVYFFSLLGIAEYAVFDAAVLLFLINILIPAVLGMFFFPRAGWWKTFRTTAATSEP